MLSWLLLLIFCTALVGTMLLLMPSGDPAVRARLASLGTRSGRAMAAEELHAEPFTARVLGPIWTGIYEQFKRLTPAERGYQIRLRMIQAGVTADPARFLGWQVLLACGLGLFFLVLSLVLLRNGKVVQAVVLPMVGLLLGWRLPHFWLGRRTKERQAGLTRMLPDVMDVLSVSVEAGLGFDGAMQKVSEKFPEPIASEFGAYLAAIRLGTPRAEALRALADRSGLPELHTFVAAMIQADQLGVSIGRVLKGQSESLRQARRQRAEEKAMQLPLKLLFPLIMFIFPTLFLVVLGPVAIQLIQLFTGDTLK